MTNLTLKKLLTLMLALCTAATCLTACGESDESSSKDTNTSSDSQTVSEVDDDKTDTNSTGDTDEPSSDVPDDDNSEEEEPFVMNTELSDNLYDYQISLDGEVFSLDCTFDYLYRSGWEFEVFTVLWAHRSSDSVNMIKDGKLISCDFIYDVDEDISVEAGTYAPELFSNATITKIMISSGWNEGFEVKTANGIICGVSTKDDMIAAYGEPAYIDEITSDTTLYYYYKNAEEYEKYTKAPSWIRCTTYKKNGTEIVDCFQIADQLTISEYTEAERAKLDNKSNG